MSEDLSPDETFALGVLVAIIALVTTSVFWCLGCFSSKKPRAKLDKKDKRTPLQTLTLPPPVPKTNPLVPYISPTTNIYDCCFIHYPDGRYLSFHNVMNRVISTFPRPSADSVPPFPATPPPNVQVRSLAELDTSKVLSLQSCYLTPPDDNAFEHKKQITFAIQPSDLPLNPQAACLLNSLALTSAGSLILILPPKTDSSEGLTKLMIPPHRILRSNSTVGRVAIVRGVQNTGSEISNYHFDYDSCVVNELTRFGHKHFSQHHYTTIEDVLK
mmetsp:Transcript_17402/g.35944  ORF Transcript_17402/g.35944 Transcript_17402/m.35944 type:complete len:272 (-) Transcript_17402:23-838(-)